MVGGLVSIIISLAFSANMEGFSTRLSNPALSKAWNATARVTNKISERFSHSRLRGDTVDQNGSGILVKKVGNYGEVLTNAHFASCPPRKRCNLFIKFQLANGKVVNTRSAHIIGLDLNKDIALISVELKNPSGLQAIDLGSAQNLNQFDAVYAIGYPDVKLRKHWQAVKSTGSSGTKRISRGDYLNSITNYVVPRLQFVDGRRVRFSVNEAIMHSADTLPGNSGGALVNDKGELIAITSGIAGVNRDEYNNGYCFKHGSVGTANFGCKYMAVGAKYALGSLGN